MIYGKIDTINHKSSKLFRGIRNPFKAARYNSLVIDSIPVDFNLTAWDNAKDIMAIEHKHLPLYGVHLP